MAKEVEDEFALRDHVQGVIAGVKSGSFGGNKGKEIDRGNLNVHINLNQIPLTVVGGFCLEAKAVETNTRVAVFEQLSTNENNSFSNSLLTEVTGKHNGEIPSPVLAESSIPLISLICLRKKTEERDLSDIGGRVLHGKYILEVLDKDVLVTYASLLFDNPCEKGSDFSSRLAALTDDATQADLAAFATELLVKAASYEEDSITKMERLVKNIERLTKDKWTKSVEFLNKFRDYKACTLPKIAVTRAGNQTKIKLTKTLVDISTVTEDMYGSEGWDCSSVDSHILRYISCLNYYAAELSKNNKFLRFVIPDGQHRMEGKFVIFLVVSGVVAPLRFDEGMERNFAALLGGEAATLLIHTYIICSLDQNGAKFYQRGSSA